jgi:hypothetical protein
VLIFFETISAAGFDPAEIVTKKTSSPGLSKYGTPVTEKEFIGGECFPLEVTGKETGPEAVSQIYGSNMRSILLKG